MATIHVSFNHQASMLKELYRQFKEGRNCDLEIRLNKKRLYVHKCLVDIFFLNAGADIESDRFFLDLQGYSLAVVEALVQFIYTGILKCPVNLVQAVHVAAKELGCIEALKGCLSYLDSPEYLQHSSSVQHTNNDKHYSNQVSDSTSTSHSECESMDREIHPDQPPEVKIEVLDDSYIYQAEEAANIAESLEYAKTITPSSNLIDRNNVSNSSRMGRPIDQFRPVDHPRTIAVPVGLHSNPEDFENIGKRITNEALKHLVSARIAAKSVSKNIMSAHVAAKSIDKDGVVKVARASHTPRKRKNKPGENVEYVYPKAPVVNYAPTTPVNCEQRTSYVKSIMPTDYIEKYLSKLGEESTKKCVKDSVDGRNTSSSDSSSCNKLGDESKVRKTSKKKKSISESQDEKMSKSVSTKKNENSCKYKSKQESVSDNSNAANLQDKPNNTEESSDSKDEDAEKNEQMLFLGLAKTIDEDKRKLEEKSNPSSTGRRLRTRKKVDYAKDIVEVDSVDETLSDSEPRRKKVKPTTKPTTVLGEDSDNEDRPIRRKKGSGSSLVKNVVKNCVIRDASYFPAAGTVPPGTRSAYATGSFMKTKFVTESIEDKYGNVTVISKRVPVRPRQFGLDERLKNRPAVYICHPTAPIVNPAPRAKP